MRLLFSRTCSWKAFELEGLPERMSALEKQRLSLASAVSAWNAAAGKASYRLNPAVVSERLKGIA